MMCWDRLFWAMTARFSSWIFVMRLSRNYRVLVVGVFVLEE